MNKKIEKKEIIKKDKAKSITSDDLHNLSNEYRFKTQDPCSECHNCCKGVLVKVREEDIERWKDEKREDIISSIVVWPIGSKFLKSKKDKNECLFLSDKGCLIHETRPLTCRRFPLSKEHAAEFNCKLSGFVKSISGHKTKKNYYNPIQKN